jgi:hypothetical protein
MQVAVGFRPHSGWAVAIVAALGPVVVGRHRLDLPGPAQPYHEAVGLPADEAAELVGAATRAAYGLAVAGVRVLADGHDVAGVAIVAGAGTVREDVPLARALAAHATLHAAEGELYRDALAEAADALGLPVTLVAPRETAALGRRVLGCDEEDLRARLTALGRPLGPPWTRDHKDALVAALAVLEP